MDRWIARHGAAADRAVVVQMQQQRTDFVRLIQTYRERLTALFRSGAAAEVMRTEKKKLYGEMIKDYQTLKQTWGGYAGYDRWFAQPPNNALLASVSIYTQQAPAFEALLKEQGGDLSKFFAVVKAMAQQPKAERDAALAARMRASVAASAP